MIYEWSPCKAPDHAEIPPSRDIRGCSQTWCNLTSGIGGGDRVASASGQRVGTTLHSFTGLCTGAPADRASLLVPRRRGGGLVSRASQRRGGGDDLLSHICAEALAVPPNCASASQQCRPHICLSTVGELGARRGRDKPCAHGFPKGGEVRACCPQRPALDPGRDAWLRRIVFGHSYAFSKGHSCCHSLERCSCAHALRACCMQAHVRRHLAQDAALPRGWVRSDVGGA